MSNDAELLERPTVDAPPPTPTDADGQQRLSADIHLLGDLLGEAIRRLAGEDAFALEEEVRAAAKELRARPSLEEARRLRDRLDKLDLSALRTLIRAFSIYFDLINLAEQQARVRALRLRAVAGRVAAAARKSRGGPAPAARTRRDGRAGGRPPAAGPSSAPSSPPTPARRGGAPSSKNWRRSRASSTGWSTPG